MNSFFEGQTNAMRIKSKQLIPFGFESMYILISMRIGRYPNGNQWTQKKKSTAYEISEENESDMKSVWKTVYNAYGSSIQMGNKYNYHK